MWKRLSVGVVILAGCTGGDGAEEVSGIDVSATRPMHVRAVSPLVGRSDGFARWYPRLPAIPRDIDWPTDTMSQATRDYQLAKRDYRGANPADRTLEEHAVHRARDAVLRADALAWSLSVEQGGTPWQAAVALHRLTERALDDQQLEDPEAVERAAVALLAAFPGHPAAVHARLVLANLAAAPTVSTYDPEQSLAWALDALAHDPDVVAEVARLLEMLPGDLPVPDWAYDLLRPQWQASEDAAVGRATFDHAIRLGHVDDALRERASVVQSHTVFCNLPDAEYVCGPFRDWDEESSARLLSLGWATSDDWRAHAHAALADCAVDEALPAQVTLSWTPGWALDGASADLESCVLSGLADAPVPLNPVGVPVHITP